MLREVSEDENPIPSLVSLAEELSRSAATKPLRTGVDITTPPTGGISVVYVTYRFQWEKRGMSFSEAFFADIFKSL